MANQFNPNQNQKNTNVSNNPTAKQQPYNKPSTTDKKGKNNAGKGNQPKDCGSC